MPAEGENYYSSVGRGRGRGRGHGDRGGFFRGGYDGVNAGQLTVIAQNDTSLPVTTFP